MFRDLLELVYPRACPGCERHLVRQEGAVCVECLLEVQETGFHRAPGDNELFYRLAGRVPLRGAAAWAWFDKKGRLKRIVQGLKYRNQPQIGRYLGAHYGAQLKEAAFLRDTAALLPVPLHRTRRASRGYNQSAMIARGLSRALDVPVRGDVLVRRARTRTQTRKSKQERWMNVRDVFAVRDPVPGHVVLVDDIITTGSTLEACIRALTEAEPAPAAISVLALGVARHD